MKRALVSAVAVMAACLAVSVGCKSSHEEGVSSNMYQQWTDVNADTKTTTEAARSVLQEEGMTGVTAQSTNVDGKAKGKKADGATVDVGIKKVNNTKSQVTVTVGKMGSPTLGAEMAKKIKTRAEGGATGTMTTPSATP